MLLWRDERATIIGPIMPLSRFRHYRAALDLEPDNVLAAFNLGTLLEDLQRLEDAIEAYKIADDFADAHYNLSRLYELLGKHELALSHLKTYRRFLEEER